MDKEGLSILHPAFELLQVTTDCKEDDDVIILQHNLIFNLFHILKLLFSSLYSGAIFMTILLLVLELTKILFIRNLTRTLENEKISV